MVSKLKYNIYNTRNSRLPQFLKIDDNKAKLQQEIADHFNVSPSTVFRWRKGVPPCPEILAELAQFFNTNIAYILGVTDVDIANKNYKINVKGKEIIKKKKISVSEIASTIGSNPRIVKDILEGKSLSRTHAILAISEILNVSIDYFLGLTDVVQWEEYHLFEDPFYLCQEGEPVLVKFQENNAEFQNNKKKYKENNKEQLLEAYGIISKNKEGVITSTGIHLLRGSKQLENAVCYPVYCEMDKNEAITRRIKADRERGKKIDF